jgi:hypothetical protein
MDNFELPDKIKTTPNSRRFYSLLGESAKMDKGKIDEVSTESKKAIDYIECQKLMDTILDDDNSRRPLSVRLKELIAIIETMH